jgi:hypothetical protein
MSRVFYARRIHWEDADGKHEQFGVPAMVRTSSACRTRDDRKRMMHTAKRCGVKLVPIQWGLLMAHGHEAVVCWLALCGGEDGDLAKMEEFLECGLVTWEHCVADKIPCAIDTTTLGRKRSAKAPGGKPLPHGEKPDPMRNVSNEEWVKWCHRK